MITKGPSNWFILSQGIYGCYSGAGHTLLDDALCARPAQPAITVNLIGQDTEQNAQNLKHSNIKGQIGLHSVQDDKQILSHVTQVRISD